MADGFEWVDREGVPVFCNRETWEEHIARRHLEVSGPEEAVRLVISQPLYVYRDARYSNRKVYYLPFVLPAPYDRFYLKVVVAYDMEGGRMKGQVITAFGEETVRESDELLWTRLRPRT